MSRRSQSSRRDAVEHWPALAAFLVSTLHGDDDRTVQDDIDLAIASKPVAERQQLASEWWDWNLSTARERDARFGIEAFDAGLAFDTAEHARAFMNDVYERLIVSIRRDLGEKWKPDGLGLRGIL